MKTNGNLWPSLSVKAQCRENKDTRCAIVPEILSDLLQPLHIMHAGNFPHALNNAFQMLQVGDV
jgi:hypothetical protein